MPTAARSRVGTSEIAASGRLASRRPLVERRVDGARRAMAVRAAAQDHGVAGLERQRAGVGGDVRPALVDHADDAERHPHALDGHAVRPRPGFGDLADRIGEARAPRRGLRPSPRRAGRSSASRSRNGGGQAGGLAVGDDPRRWRRGSRTWRRGSPAPCRRARDPSAPSRRAPAPARRPWRARPMSRIVAAMSPDPSMVFSGAVMVVGRYARTGDFATFYHVLQAARRSCRRSQGYRCRKWASTVGRNGATAVLLAT